MKMEYEKIIKSFIIWREFCQRPNLKVNIKNFRSVDHTICNLTDKKFKLKIMLKRKDKRQIVKMVYEKIIIVEQGSATF